MSAPPTPAPPLAHEPAAPAMTARSLALGVPVLLLWIFLVSWSVPDDDLRQQQMLLLGGFGAIFSIFALKLLVDFLPPQRRLGAAEMAFVYALLVMGIPASCMGRLALESAVGNHFLADIESGPRGMTPDFWAPNPNLGFVPRLDPPDGRCPFIELPPHEDGTPRRPAQTPPSFEASRAAVAESLNAARAAQTPTTEAAQQVDRSEDVLRVLEQTRDALALAERAAARIAELDQTQAEPHPEIADRQREAAYLAWAAGHAAEAAQRGPQCVQAADAVRGFRKGKSGVPWGAWLTPLLYWLAVMFSFHFAFLMFLLALRESWVERERLPFPYAKVTEGILRPVPSEPLDTKRQESFPSLGLAIAFGVGLLFCVRGLVSISETNQASIPPENAILDLDLTWLDLVKGEKLHLLLLPFALVFILLFPLDLLATAVVAYLIAGYGIPSLFEMFGVAPPVDVRYRVLRMGGVLGISLFSVIFHRKELARLFTGLWQRARGGDAQPIGSRELSAGFIAAFSALALLIVFGQGDTGSLFTRVTMFAYVAAMAFIYNFHHIRMRASAGFQYFDFNNILHAGSWFNWHLGGQVHSVPMAQGSAILEPDKALSYHALYQLETFGAYSKAMGPNCQVLEAFALGSAVRARGRDILKAVLIGLALALLVGMPLYLISMYHVGYDNTPMAGAWNNMFLTTNKAWRYYTKLNPGMFTRQSIGWVILGAAIYGVCMYLRREYSRFPVEPIGLFIAGSDGGRTILGTDFIWFTFVVALGVKWVLFRWYGVRAFQERVAPWIVYCLMGMTLGMVLYLFLNSMLLAKGMAFQ